MISLLYDTTLSKITQNSQWCLKFIATVSLFPYLYVAADVWSLHQQQQVRFSD